MVELMLNRPFLGPISPPTSTPQSTSLEKTTKKSPPRSLPSVSVCVPAHEESFIERLALCLEHILASDYPKLEIIVVNELLMLDPSKELKQFAGKGVRFVHPDVEPTDSHNDLLREASGHLVCFVDVDTHIEPTTIGQLVDRFMNESAVA